MRRDCVINRNDNFGPWRLRMKQVPAQCRKKSQIQPDPTLQKKIWLGPRVLNENKPEPSPCRSLLQIIFLYVLLEFYLYLFLVLFIFIIRVVHHNDLIN